MNAAIYARVSTDWQAEHGYSIETQLESCRAKAKEIGATVIKEYVDDGYSGGFLERPGLDALRDAVSDGLYDVVIFHDPDRMARKLIHQLIITEELEKAGAAPVFVLERFDSSPEGQMNYQMKGVFAEYERAKIRERTMRGKRAKLRAGKAICDSHIYGYDFDRASSSYVVNPTEAAVVRRVYHLYVVERVGGCETIADILNADNIPSPTGRKWSPSSVRNMLSRPHYTGHYYANTTYHKKTGPRSEKRLPRPREEWIEMSCPQILPAEMHEKALAIKAGQRTYKVWKRNAKVALLQGIAYCGSCGSRIYVSGGGKRGRRFYECGAARAPSYCPARLMEVPVADDLFWNVLEQICKSPAALEKYIGENVAEKGSRPAAAEKPEKIARRLEKIAGEKKAVMAWFSQSLLTQSEATERLSGLKSEELRLQSELADLRARSSREPEKIALSDICAAVAACSVDLAARRRVVLAVVERVDVLRRDFNYGHKYIVDFKIKFK